MAQGKTLIISAEKREQTLEGKDVRYVHIKSLKASEVLEALTLIMPRADIYVPTEGGLVILNGPTKTLDLAEELLLALDASIPSKAETIQERSLLAIFQDLSNRMGLTLVADPALAQKKLYLDLRAGEPEELIKQIQRLIPLDVEITGHSLVVGMLTETSGERLKVYRLNYVELDAAREALSLLVNPDKIRTDRERESIIIRGTDAQLAEVDLFLIDFDRPKPQVLLEVWVQEVSTEAMRKLGVDWQGTPSFKGGEAPVFFELDFDSWDLIWALKALEDQGDAKLLANPKIATLSGQEASIFVGDRVPIVLTGEDGSRSVNFLEAGIDLKVTPKIADDLYITILVKPEVSTFIWKAGTDYPQIRTREAETTVRVKDGQPIIIGGLIQEEEAELITQIPFLSQLPVLGRLFQWKELKQNQTEMTIFMIPRIVKGEQVQAEQSFFPSTR